MGSAYRRHSSLRRGTIRLASSLTAVTLHWLSTSALAQSYGLIGDLQGSQLEQFASSVALSADGNILAVGATSLDDIFLSRRPGYARVFAFDGSTWHQLGQTMTGSVDVDAFGRAVSLSSDGHTIAVGAPYNDPDDTNAPLSGEVRVFDYDEGVGIWAPRGDPINGTATRDNAGWHLSLSSDGNTLAISYPQRGVFEAGNDGPALFKIYQWATDTWEQLGASINGEALHDSAALADAPVALSGNGKVVAIGAPTADHGGLFSGRVRVYQFDGLDWQPLGNSIDGTTGDESGVSVALSDDGTMLAVGAQRDNLHLHAPGRARVYQYNGATWKQLGNDITGTTAADWASYVSLSSDGHTLLVGAPDRLGPGRASVYKFDGTFWNLRGDAIPSGADNHSFGATGALSADGNTVVIGDPIFGSLVGATDGRIEEGQARIYRWRDALPPGILWFITRGAQVEEDSP